MAAVIQLRHPSGSTAQIMPYGATIVSWQTPAQPNPLEHLFVSSKAFRDGSKPVRGGIPVVWPIFGPDERKESPGYQPLPQHGFARSSTWKVVKEEGVSVTLTLDPSAISVKYDPKFLLSYVVTLGEYDLTTELRVTNPEGSSTSLDFQALFHNYLLAPSQAVKISNLEKLAYVDKTDLDETGKGRTKTEKRKDVQVTTFTDSVYENAGGEYEITWDAPFGIRIKTENLKDVVVWNPHAEASSGMKDMEEGGWKNFVCCEPGHVRGFVQLKPEETWTGKQVLSVIRPESSHQ
ncbi:galactose mutarotase-like protein [Mycena vitilis]|nr:galactose mutarotase-like protein [Mycena vitilis]